MSYLKLATSRTVRTFTRYEWTPGSKTPRRRRARRTFRCMCVRSVCVCGSCVDARLRRVHMYVCGQQVKGGGRKAGVYPYRVLRNATPPEIGDKNWNSDPTSPDGTNGCHKWMSPPKLISSFTAVPIFGTPFIVVRYHAVEKRARSNRAGRPRLPT